MEPRLNVRQKQRTRIGLPYVIRFRKHNVRMYARAMR